jgi:hypothetical protein
VSTHDGGHSTAPARSEPEPQGPTPAAAEGVQLSPNLRVGAGPTAWTRILGLQRGVGNRATVRMLTRHGPPGGTAEPPAGAASGSASSALPPEAARKLLYAQATLSKVEPIGAADKAALEMAVPGATAFELIKYRDAKAKALKEKTDELERVKPQSGQPSDAEAKVIAGLTDDIDALQKAIDAFKKQIDEHLAELKLTKESDLVDLVTVRFPHIVVERGKRIALTQLAQNRKMAETEAARYGAGKGTPAERDGLRAAAKDLADKANDIKSLEKTRTPLLADRPDAGVDWDAKDKVDSLNREIEGKQKVLDDKRRVYELQYPILFKPLNLEEVAGANDAKLAALTGGAVGKIIDDVTVTENNVRDEKVKVWDLPDILTMTRTDLGIEGNTTLEAVFDAHVETQRSEEANIKLAVGALSLTAGVIAALATAGGATVAAASAASVGLVAGSYNLGRSVDDYLAQSAAGNVALDPAIAAIHAKEPDLFWLVLEIVVFLADAKAVVSAFNALSAPARMVMETGETGLLAMTAKSRLPPDGAERLVANAGRRFGGKALAKPRGPYDLIVSTAGGTRTSEELIGTLVRDHPQLAQIRNSLAPLNTTLVADAGVSGEAHTTYIRVQGPDGKAFTRGAIHYHPDKAKLSDLYHELNHLQDFVSGRVPAIYELEVEAAEFTRLEALATDELAGAARAAGKGLAAVPLVTAAQSQVRKAVAEIRNTLRDMDEFCFHWDATNGRRMLRPGVTDKFDAETRILRRWEGQLRAAWDNGVVLGRPATDILNEVERADLKGFARKYIEGTFPELSDEYTTLAGSNLYVKLGLER